MAFLAMHLRQLTSCLVCIFIAGCMAGPNFKPPQAPETDRYTENPMPAKTTSVPHSGSAGRAQYFINAADIPAQWWRLYHCPELNALIEEGIANSPNLAAAKARLAEAKQALRVQIGTLLYPTIQGAFSAQRSQISGLGFGSDTPASIFNIYNASVTASYNPDVFGGSRRQIESYRAQVDYQREELMAAYLTLTSNIVTTAITVASLEEQIRTTHQLIQIEEQLLSIIEKQVRLGGASGENVFTQQTLLAQTRATLPPLEKNLSQQRNALAVLVGSLPSEAYLPHFDLEALHLPTYLPVSLPSNLILQRPDVRAAEAQLHQASAQIGVATANLLPQFSLPASYGYNGSSLGSLFAEQNLVWSYGIKVTQTIFQGGALIAQRRQTIAAFQATFAEYQQTVLQAYQNVADALRAIDTDAQAFKAQKQAEIAARGSMNITQKQFHLGGTSFTALLNAQQQYQQTVLARIQAQALRYTDTAALFQALGGGWWNNQSQIDIPLPKIKVPFMSWGI
jgi:NodT family efflux transporter outer membrane factor (OMF) lipoprotein